MQYVDLGRKIIEDDINYYMSPFVDRYGTKPLRKIWSENNKRKMRRMLWIAVLKMQQAGGMPLPFDMEDLTRIATIIDKRIPPLTTYHAEMVLEKQTKHDIAAAIANLEEEFPQLEGYVHVNMTSSDVVDMVDQVRIVESLKILSNQIEVVIKSLIGWTKYNYPYRVLARTHLQPAGITTVGNRFIPYIYALEKMKEEIDLIVTNYRYKGIRGPVGMDTGSMLFEVSLGIRLDQAIDMGIEMDEYVTQTYSRVKDLEWMGILCRMAALFHKMHQDIRLMAAFGEISEKKSETQVGSSSIPFKTNPITSEKVCGLARRVPLMYQEMWSTAATQMLERTLDDSSSRRYLIPESFLIVSEILYSTNDLLKTLTVNARVCDINIEVGWRGWVPEIVATALMIHERLGRNEAQKVARSVADHGIFLNGMKYLRLEHFHNKQLVSDQQLTPFIFAEEPNHLMDLLNLDMWDLENKNHLQQLEKDYA